MRLGQTLGRDLRRLCDKYPHLVESVRGTGLLQGLVLRPEVDARAILGKVRDAGLLLTVAGGRALRFSPPLVVSEAQLGEGVAVVDRVLGEH